MELSFCTLMYLVHDLVECVDNRIVVKAKIAGISHITRAKPCN